MGIKWGIILEISTKKPKHYPHQKAAPTRRGSDQHWNKGDLSWQCGILKEEPNVSSQSPSSVKSGSCSQPQWKISPGQISRLSSLAPTHKDVAKTWMHMNGEIELYVKKTNSQGYPWGRLSWKLSSAPHFQRSPHQLQIPIHTVQWKLPGNTPDDQQALQMNHTLKSNNLMMPSSGNSAHRYN